MINGQELGKTQIKLELNLVSISKNMEFVIIFVLQIWLIYGVVDKI